MRRRRFWLAFAYGLTTLLVQSLHEHGKPTSEPSAVGIDGCDDPGLHVAGHGAPEMVRPDVDCVACQFRADHQSDAVRACSLPKVARPGSVAIRDDRLHPRSHVRACSRAPPLA